MTDHGSDPHLDAHLRDVRVPDGLVERLRAVAVLTDGQLDAEICSVALPSGLLDRVKEAVADESLDERIRDVELPWGLLARLRCIPYARQHRVLRLAAAAVLFLLISTAYLATIGGLLSSFRPKTAQQINWEIPYDVPLDIEYVAYLTPSPTGPVDQVVSELQSNDRLFADVALLRYGPLGFPDRSGDELPELDVPPPDPRAGIEPPLLPQYNRQFLVVEGVHPVVFPAAHEQLRTSSVPLSASTASYDLTAQKVATHRLPASADVRVEDFLAAMDYQFTLPKPGQLGLRVSAGPSEFGRTMPAQLARELGSLDLQQPAGLLQVGVQAGRVAKREQPVTHLTIALDISNSMRWGGRLEMVQRALRHVIDQLEPRDRLSLLAFNEEVRLRIDSASAQHKQALLEDIDRLTADGGTNVAGGLQQAISLAMNGSLDKGTTRRLVLITDGRTSLDSDARTKLAELLSWASDEGLQFDVFEINEDSRADPILAELAAAAGRGTRKVPDADLLRSNLLEALTGGSTLVAGDVQLSVTFNADAVFAYRLLGHEASGGGGLLVRAVESELESGEAATALYEVWLRPGTEETVGWANLKWTHAATGQSRSLRQRIIRLQFATSFDSAAPSLQAATIAAETAEILRESPFAESRSRDLQPVLDVAERVNSRLAEQHGFRQFMSLVQEAELVRSRPGGP